MNKVFTHFIVLITMLCLSVSSVFAANNIEGNYVSDMETSVTMFGSPSNDSIKKQGTVVTKISDTYYDVNFGSLKLSGQNVKLKYKNLVFDGTSLTYGSDSYIDGADVSNAKFSATLNENNEFVGTTSFSYSGFAQVSISFVMTPGSSSENENTGNTAIKELTFKNIPYYNTINNQDKTKDEFATLKVSVYKNYVNISSDEYVVKLSESNNLTAKVALNLENLKYTTNEDTTVITIVNGETMFNITEYNISTKTTVNATFNANADTAGGNFSYVLGGDGGLLDIASGGTVFNVTCNFGNHIKDMNIVDEQFDFDFNNATHYFAKVENDENVNFEHAYLSADAKTLVLYPVKLSGISQQLAISFDVDTTHANIIDEKYKVNITNIAIQANGNAKQYIKSLGTFSAFGNVEGQISGILSADEQFVGQATIGGSLVSTIDVKAPTVLYSGEITTYYCPICGYSVLRWENPVAIDSVCGLLKDDSDSNIQEKFDLVNNSKNILDDGNPLDGNDTIIIKDCHLNETKCVLSVEKYYSNGIYPDKDTTITYQTTESSPYIDATGDIENAIRELIGNTNCNYTIDIPEMADRCKLGETVFTITVGEFTSNVTIIVKESSEKPSSANDVKNNASSIYYSNGVLSVNGYDAERVEVFSIIGTKLLDAPMAEQIKVSLAKGVYLVKVGNATEKVVVK